MAFDRILTDLRIVTMADQPVIDDPVIDDGAIGIAGDRIAWVGHRADLPDAGDAVVEELGGRLATPGLIDCHTHLVFGGDRSREFAQRVGGASYQQIAAAGGGIVATTTATRALSVDQLVADARPRLCALIADGVTTVEIKSGYALDREGELAMLRAARALGADGGVRVTTTFLGLHALPPEYAGRSDAYVDHVVADILPVVAAEGLADAVDAYVEPIAFSVAQAERFFAAAAAYGLPAKVHADQLSRGGGTALAARIGALSADHVEYADDRDAAAMAEAGTVATLLPGAFLTLRETRRPPVDAFRRHRVPMAVATDCNPGTSPMTSLLLAMNLSCTLFGLTPDEALAGTTRNAARALGLCDRIGTIARGMLADLAIWDASGPAELSYWMGLSRLYRRYVGGVTQPCAETVKLAVSS